MISIPQRLPQTYSSSVITAYHDEIRSCVTVMIRGRGTSYPWTGLPIKSVLVGTHVRCLLGDRRRASLFLSCTQRLRAKLVPRWENLWFFHLRYAYQVLQIRSKYLNPGNYRDFRLIQDSIITLAHSDEPYMQKYGIFMETPIPRTRTWVEDAAPQNPLPHLWMARQRSRQGTPKRKKERKA